MDNRYYVSSLRFAFMATVLIGFASCQSGHTSNSKSTKLTIDKAFAIGFRALEDQGSVNGRDLEIRIRKLDAKWVMSVSMLPATPSAEFVVTIDESGKATILPLF